MDLGLRAFQVNLVYNLKDSWMGKRSKPITLLDM